MRYFLHLSYLGTHYRGWQRQPNVVSIQATLERVVSEVLKRKTTIVGCGRTDAGVHASQYFCFFDLLEGELSERFVYILNRRLPTDISVYAVMPVEDRQHPRYDATARTYDYFVHTQKEASLSPVSAWIDAPELDRSAIKNTLDKLVGEHDFRAYCKGPDRHDHTLCTMLSTGFWASEDGRYLRFQFTANRFLRGMIRLLVGNLMLVGQAQQDGALLLERLQQLEPPLFAKYAPPEGLYLSKVTYPYLELGNESGLQQSLEQLSSEF